MTETTKAGELIIQIIADTTKLDKGIKTADKEIKSLTGTTDKAKKSAANMQTQMDTTGRTASTEARQIDTLTRSTEETAQAADTASISDEQMLRVLRQLVEGYKKTNKEAKEAGDGVEKEGDQAEKAAKKNEKHTSSLDKMKAAADKAKEGIKLMNKVLGVIGITVGISQLVGMIKDLAQAAKEAHENLEKVNQSTQFKYGLTEEQTQKSHEIASKIAQQIPVDQSKIQEITAALLHEYPDLINKEEFLKISQEFAAFARAAEIDDISGFMTSFFNVLSKYKIDMEDWDTFLKELLATSQKSRNAPPEKLLDLMYNNDQLQKYAGWDYSKILRYMGASTYSSDPSSIQSIGSTLEKISNMLIPILTENAKTEEAGKKYIEWENKTFRTIPRNYDKAYDILIKEGVEESDADAIAQYYANFFTETNEKIKSELKKAYKSAYDNMAESKTAEFKSEIKTEDLDINVDEIIIEMLKKAMNTEDKDVNKIISILTADFKAKVPDAENVAKTICANLDIKGFSEDVTKQIADRIGESITEYVQKKLITKDYDTMNHNNYQEENAKSPSAKWFDNWSKQEYYYQHTVGDDWMLAKAKSFVDAFTVAIKGPFTGEDFEDLRKYRTLSDLRNLSTPVQSIADNTETTGENIPEMKKTLDSIDKNLTTFNTTIEEKLKTPLTTTNITNNFTTAQPPDSYFAREVARCQNDENSKTKGGTY